MTPFFVTALPRSGTTFLANFLTHAGVFCWHEALCGCPDTYSLRQRMTLRDYCVVGDSDSGLIHCHADVRQEFPGARWIGVDRRPEDVLSSLCQNGGWPGLDAFEAMVEGHRQALRDCDLVVTFDNLFLTETLRNVWEVATRGLRFDARRAAMLADMKVEPDLSRYWPRYAAHLQQKEARPC